MEETQIANTAVESSSTVSDSYRGRHLWKEVRWYDGFILALAVPIFLFPDLGSSAVALGVIGTVGIWLASVVMGALQSNLYAELALMFPSKAGSIPSYAHEAFKRWSNLPGAFVGWGYWLGWCVVLSINGLLVGDYLQANVFTSMDRVAFPKIVATVMLVMMLGIDVVGLRTGKFVRYALGLLTMVPILIIMFGSYLTGHFSPAHFSPVGLPGNLGTWGAVSLVFYWMYIAGWSSYAFEAVATHAPEYKNSLRDTALALRSSALFSVVVYALVPLGLIAALGTAGIASDTLTPFDKALKAILGSGAGTAIVFVVIAALILSAQMAAVASVRALWQMSENGLTVTGFLRLNRWGEPDIAILFTYGFNILLVWTLGSPLWILAASNVGYIGSHIIGLIGFMVLRRTQPNALRPINLGPAWFYIAGVLAVLNLSFVLIGAPQYGLQPLLAGLGTFAILAFGLYAFKKFIQPAPAALEASQVQ